MSDPERMSFLLEKYSQLSTDAIINGLSEHYIRNNLQASFDDLGDEASAKSLLKKIIYRLASLEADNFQMKACLATGQRYVAASPLSTANSIDIIEQLFLPSPSDSSLLIRSRVVELGPDVIGNGWYPTEQSPDGYWRWSGPEKVATLILPAVGPGLTRLSFEASMLVPSDMEKVTFAVNGRPASNVTIAPLDHRRFSITIEAQVSVRREPSFLMLRMEVPRTVSPAEIDGAHDPRLLGIGLGRIRIELQENTESIGLEDFSRKSEDNDAA